MQRQKIIRHLFAIVLVVIIGVCAGRVGRLLYVMNFSDISMYEQDDIVGDSEIVDHGKNYSILPVMIDQAAPLAPITALLKAYQIDYKIHENKAMVAADQMPLALDLLQVAGYGGEVRNFSAREITADPTTEPARFALQNQLAAQNMLAEMLPLLDRSITGAAITGNPVTNTVTITLQRRDKTPLSDHLRAEINHHATALLGAAEKVIIQ